MEYGGGSRLQRAMANFRANKLQLLCTAAYCFTFLGLGISMTGIGPTLLELADLTHSSIKEMGYIISIKGVGYLLGSMSGRLYDRYDGHKLQFGSTLITASLVFLVPFIKTIWGQGMVWFGVGLFTGCIDTGANTLTVWTWNEKVPPYMQLLHFSFGVGAFLSPVVLSMLQEEALYKQYMALAIPLAAAALPVIFFKSPTNTNAIKEVELNITESPKETLILNHSDSSSIMEETTQEEEEETTQSNTDSDGLQQSSEVSIISSGNIDYIHNPNYNVKRLRVEAIFFSAVMLFLDVGAEIGFGGYIFTYANKQLGFSDKDSAYLNAAFWGTFTIGRLAAVGISFYLTPKAMLFLDAIGSIISMAILLVFPKSEIAIWVCTVGYGLSIASVYPTAISLPQTLGVELTGADTSWLVIGGSAGEVIIPLLIGVLQEHFSLYVMIFVMLIVVTMGGITLCVLLIRVKHLKNESVSIFANLLKNRNVVAFSELAEESDLVI